MSYRYRVKCACGHVMNAQPGDCCPKCNQPVMFCPDGLLSLYRMGNFFGIANGFSVYIDGEPMGRIGNRETIHVPLPFGTHNLHIACGMSRRCNDYLFTLTPNFRNVYAKVWIKPGFWTNSFVIEPVSANDIPY